MKQKKISTLLLAGTILLSSTAFASASNDLEAIKNTQGDIELGKVESIQETDVLKNVDIEVEARAVTAVTTSNVNLREKASTKSKSLLILNKGSVVTVLDSVSHGS